MRRGAMFFAGPAHEGVQRIEKTGLIRFSAARLTNRVIDRPVVGGVGRVARVRRALLVRDAARAAPVEVHAERLDAERLVLREGPIGVAERLADSSKMPTISARDWATSGEGRAPDGATSPATRAATAARTPRAAYLRTDLLQGRKHSAQAFLELDLGLPAEQLLGARDVGLPDLRVVDGQRLEDDLARRLGRRGSRSPRARGS